MAVTSEVGLLCGDACDRHCMYLYVSKDYIWKKTIPYNTIFLKLPIKLASLRLHSFQFQTWLAGQWCQQSKELAGWSVSIDVPTTAPWQQQYYPQIRNHALELGCCHGNFRSPPNFASFSPHLPTNYRTWVPTSLWNVGKQMLDTLTSQVFVQTVNVVQLLAGGLSRRRFLRFRCHDWAVEIWDVVYKKFHIFEKRCLTVKIQKPFCLIFCDFILWIFSHCFRKNGRSFMFRFSGFNA